MEATWQLQLLSLSTFHCFFCIISHQHHILYLFYMISIFILKPMNAATNNYVVLLQADLVLVKHLFSHIDVVRLWILLSSAGKLQR